MAHPLQLPGLHRPRLPRGRVAAAHAPPTTPAAGDLRHALTAAVTIVCAVGATGSLVHGAMTAPDLPATGPVAVHLVGTLDTAGLVDGGVTTSQLTVTNRAAAPLRWSWQPVARGPRVAVGALGATATLGRCGSGAVSVTLPPGRDAPVLLPPGGRALLCVRLVLPEEAAAPLDVEVQVRATSAAARG